MSSVLDAGNVDENADRGGTICVDLGGWPSPICGGCWWMFRVGGYACAREFMFAEADEGGNVDVEGVSIDGEDVAGVDG